MFHIPPGIDGYASAMKQKKLTAAGAASATDRKDPSGQNQAGRGTPEATCASAIVPMWKVEWTAQFDALLAKYSDTVVATFAAHTHSDDFRVVGNEFVLMNPAISPVYSQNPGFRVVNFARDGRLTDQSTYSLTNLLEASAKVKGRWSKEYTFTKQWKERGLNAASLNQVYGRLAADENARADWLKLYAVSGPAEEGERPIVKALYCAVEGLRVEDYERCWCEGK